MTYPSLIYITLSVLLLPIVDGQECGGNVLLTDPVALSAMMVSTENRCGQLNLTRHRLSCTTLKIEDEAHLSCRGSNLDTKCSSCNSLCPDGSLEKTCFPVANRYSLHYTCICHSALNGQVYTTTQATWSPWQIMDVNYEHFNYTRKLYIYSGTVCLAQECDTDPAMYIISGNNLPDAIFSASSIWGRNHEAYRARIDKYFTTACGWVGQREPSWIQIYLPIVYYINGLLIKQRCDHREDVAYAQYATVISVETVNNTMGHIEWENVLVDTDINDLYTAFERQGSATLWFSKIYSTLVWRIYVRSYIRFPAMKCDLMGYVYP